MLNLVFCLLFLLLAVCVGIYEFKYSFVKHTILCYIFRFIVCFGFGFMLMETIKWLCGIKTLIFQVMDYIKELEDLYKDIIDKGEYLEKYTYSQYDHCYQFANRLKVIIEKIKENRI